MLHGTNSTCGLLIITTCFFVFADKNGSMNPQCVLPLNDNDTLCNTENVTLLQCYLKRFTNTSLAGGYRWINVCIFHSKVGDLKNNYTCSLHNETELVHCHSRFDQIEHKNFTSKCSFTFFQSHTPSYTHFKELYEEGECASSQLQCQPLNDLYVLNKVYDHHLAYEFRGLKPLIFRASSYCKYSDELSIRISLITIGVILFLVFVSCLFQWKRMKRKIKTSGDIEIIVNNLIESLENTKKYYIPEATQEKESYCAFDPTVHENENVHVNGKVESSFSVSGSKPDPIP